MRQDLAMDLNRAQRVVLVIGWGLILATVAAALSAELAPASMEDGWFNYAPNEGILTGYPDGANWGRAATWLGAVALWTVGSLLLLRSGRSSSSSEPAPEGGPV